MIVIQDGIQSRNALCPLDSKKLHRSHVYQQFPSAKLERMTQKRYIIKTLIFLYNYIYTTYKEDL